MNQYLELLNIQLLHSYYKDGICKDINVVPDKDTSSLMQQFGMRLVRRQDGISLFTLDTFDLQDFDENNPDLVLVFHGTPQTSVFWNFTDFPLSEIGKLFFTNVELELNDEGQGVLNKSFERTSGASSEIATIQIQLDELAVDPSEWPTKYVIQFHTRYTRWKYFIIDPENQFEALQLEGEWSEYFSGPTEDKLHNGEHALVFDSGENLLRLSEQGGPELKLKGRHSGLNKPPFLMSLPHASPDHLSSEMVDGEQEIYSSIYVYL